MIGLLLTGLGVLIGLVVGVASLFVLPRPERRFDWIDALFCLLVIPALVPLVALFVNYAGRHGAEPALTATYAISVAFPFIAGRLFRLLRPTPGGRSDRALLGSAAGILLLVGGWVAMEQTDRHRGLWLFRMLFGDSFDLEVQVALTVDGQPVRFARRITCIDAWTTQGVSDLPAFTSGEILYADTRSIGARAPTGGAVMLVLPDWCRDVEDWAARTPNARDGATAYPLPEDYLPLIAWTPTPDDPEMIEAYVARSYYARPDARVRFHDLAVRIALPEGNTPRDDGFDWLRPVKGERRHVASPTYIAIGAHVTPADAVLEDSIIAEQLESTTSARFFVRGTEMSDSLTAYAPIQVSGGANQDGLARQTRLLPDAPVVESYDHVIPLRREGDTFVASPDEYGVLAYYRNPAWHDPDHGPMRMQFGDDVVTDLYPRALGGRGIVYDPHRRVLYTVFRDIF